MLDGALHTRPKARDIASRLIEARDKAEFDRIAAACEHDRNCCGCCLGCKRSRGGRSDCHHSAPDEFGYQLRYGIELALQPVNFDRYVRSIDKALSFRRLRKAAASAASPFESPGSMNATTGIAGCYARATSGHAATGLSPAMKARRLARPHRTQAECDPAHRGSDRRFKPQQLPRNIQRASGAQRATSNNTR